MSETAVHPLVPFDADAEIIRRNGYAYSYGWDVGYGEDCEPCQFPAGSEEAKAWAIGWTRGAIAGAEEDFGRAEGDGEDEAIVIALDGEGSE